MKKLVLFILIAFTGSYTFAQNMNIKTLPYPQTKKLIPLILTLALPFPILTDGSKMTRLLIQKPG